MIDPKKVDGYLLTEGEHRRLQLTPQWFRLQTFVVHAISTKHMLVFIIQVIPGHGGPLYGPEYMTAEERAINTAKENIGRERENYKFEAHEISYGEMNHPNQKLISHRWEIKPSESVRNNPR